MGYRLKKGVVLFEMFGEHYLFPSRSSGASLGFLVTASPGLAVYLQSGRGPDMRDLREEDREKLQRLAKLGFVEEC